jgi:ribosomal protein S1
MSSNINNLDYRALGYEENSDHIRVRRDKIPVKRLEYDKTRNTTGKTIFVMVNGGISGQKHNNQTAWSKYGGGKSKKYKKSRRSRKSRSSRKSRRSRK